MRISGRVVRSQPSTHQPGPQIGVADAPERRRAPGDQIEQRGAPVERERAIVAAAHRRGDPGSRHQLAGEEERAGCGRPLVDPAHHDAVEELGQLGNRSCARGHQAIEPRVRHRPAERGQAKVHGQQVARTAVVEHDQHPLPPHLSASHIRDQARIRRKPGVTSRAPRTSRSKRLSRSGGLAEQSSQPLGR